VEIYLIGDLVVAESETERERERERGREKRAKTQGLVRRERCRYIKT